MATGSARAFAAAFRAIGLDAEPTPPSDHRTRELGARYTSGDECYPAKVTVGDFMKLLEDSRVDPARIALFMPTAEGPCRFGQYAPYLRHVLDANGYQAVQILSPSSKNSYDGLGSLAKPFVRSGWRALLCADLLEKLLLMRRPYEQMLGDAEAAYEESLTDLCHTIETTTVEPGEQLTALGHSMLRARERFGKLDARRDREQPLIGIVGEIFCRLNTFSNENLIGSLEQYGAEAWLSDIVEWVWYTNSEVSASSSWKIAFGAWRRSARGCASACRSAMSTAWWISSARISPAAKSPISTRFWNARAPTCRAKALSAKWCSTSARPSTWRRKARPASSTSAPSPA